MNEQGKITRCKVRAVGGMINYIPSKGVCHKPWVRAEVCVLSLSWRSRTCHSVCFALLKWAFSVFHSMHMRFTGQILNAEAYWQKESCFYMTTPKPTLLLGFRTWRTPSDLSLITLPHSSDFVLSDFPLVPSPKATPSTSITKKRWKWPCQNG